MHHTEKTLQVNVPAEKIWQVLDDFGSVEKFALTIKSSPVVGDKKTGMGARRLCTFNDGSTLVEEITEYQQGQGYKMALSEFSLPLKSMNAEMRVKAIDENTSELYMSSDFVVKAGPLGWLMGALIMKPVMKGVFNKLLSGLAYYVVTGNAIADKMPSDDELKNIVIG